jgi:mannitol-specific phosphotransferase system IIBC component
MVSIAHTRGEAVEYLMTTYGVSYAQAYADTREALKKKYNIKDRKGMRASAMASLQHIARRAEETGNFTAAISAINTMCKLAGLFETPIVEVHQDNRQVVVNNNNINMLRAEERVDKLKEIAIKAGLTESQYDKLFGEIEQNQLVSGDETEYDKSSIIDVSSDD